MLLSRYIYEFGEGRNSTSSSSYIVEEDDFLSPKTSLSLSLCDLSSLLKSSSNSSSSSSSATPIRKSTDLVELAQLVYAVSPRHGLLDATFVEVYATKIYGAARARLTQRVVMAEVDDEGIGEDEGEGGLQMKASEAEEPHHYGEGEILFI